MGEARGALGLFASKLSGEKGTPLDGGRLVSMGDGWVEVGLRVVGVRLAPCGLRGCDVDKGLLSADSADRTGNCRLYELRACRTGCSGAGGGRGERARGLISGGASRPR